MKIRVNKIIPGKGIQLLREAGLEVLYPAQKEFSPEEIQEYLQHCEAMPSAGSDT